MDHTFFTQALDHVLAPFASVEIFLTSLVGTITAVTDLRSRTGWFYLITSLATAIVVYVVGRRRGSITAVSLRRFLFPREIYGHRSARADYKFVSIDLTIKPLLYTPLVTGFSLVVYKLTSRLVEGSALARPTPELVAGSILVPILVILAADFGLFFYHYLMHKIPVLWYFHQVHHSAEVLTPATVYRQHPVEDLVFGVVAATISGIGGAVYTSATARVVSVPTILGVNVVSFLFYSVAYQLRHSHIWVSYGPILSWLFISPAQHQIHHSIDPRHWEKNFGFVFAFWDALFRCLYVPKGRETLSFGLTETDPSDFLTVRKLYVLPFAKAARLVRTETSAAIGPVFARKRGSGRPPLR